MDPGSLPWWVPKETLTNAQRPCCAGVEELNFSRGAGASRVPRPAPQVSLGGGPTGGPSGPFRAPRARARLPEATPPPDPRQVRSLVPQDARAPPGRRAAGKRAGGGLRVPGSHAAARPRPWCTVGVAAPTPRPSGWGRGLEAWGRGGHAPRSLTGRLWTRVPRSARPPPSPRPRGSHLGGSGNRVGSGQAAWVLASVYAPGSRIRHRAWGGRVEDGQGSPCGDPLGGDCKVPMGAGRGSSGRRSLSGSYSPTRKPRAQTLRGYSDLRGRLALQPVRVEAEVAGRVSLETKTLRCGISPPLPLTPTSSRAFWSSLEGLGPRGNKRLW